MGVKSLSPLVNVVDITVRDQGYEWAIKMFEYAEKPAVFQMWWKGHWIHADSLSDILKFVREDSV